MARRGKSIHGEWSSRWAFILAATGSAVGLGNIWKFPYITGEYGGGAFVLAYLACIALIGVPIMTAEILVGRRGRQSPINTMNTLAIEAGRTPAWRMLGGIGVLAGFLILSYYSVIAGWALAYVFRTGTGMFTGATADGVQSIFAALVADPERLIAWHTVFMAMTIAVVARGVRGLEGAVRYLMPALFMLLVLLVGYSMSTGYFGQALEFLFRPDFHALMHRTNAFGNEVFSWEGVLAAMGQAFFTLSLGMGAIMVYGSYLSHRASIVRTSITIAAADTFVAILAGLAIFPIVFANGLEPGVGAGLVFQTLPLAFGHMPGGAFFGALFFILLVVAAWTSAISIMEPVVAWLVENRGWRRIQAASLAGAITWATGLLTVFSFNIWSDVRPLGAIDIFRDKTIFDLLDYLTANILLPLGGMLIAVFAGWMMSREATRDELGLGDSPGYRLWRFLVRYITPTAVLIVIVNLLANS